MKDLLKTPIIINAVLFQLLWFACVLGGARQLLWPAVIAAVVMLVWQLHPSRRHPRDYLVLAAALLLGIVIDSLWVGFGVMQFQDPRPFPQLAPGFIIIMWLGFALTVNHSLAWMAKHWLLPVGFGLIGGPLAYLAGERLGAVHFLQETWLVCALLGLVWATVLVLLVKISESGLQSSSAETIID